MVTVMARPIAMTNVLPIPTKWFLESADAVRRTPTAMATAPPTVLTSVLLIPTGPIRFHVGVTLRIWTAMASQTVLTPVRYWVMIRFPGGSVISVGLPLGGA
jgi:hypothetical protein